jgi:flavin reductase (DIM6/NTAB) family NADH-FMN oxidoreductase RutF
MDDENPKIENKKGRKMEFKPFMREGFMPLPIAFISTVSKDGIRNIAPYSCIMPVLRPLDLICLASAEKRDTLVNIRETNQFVVNLAGADFSDKVIPTARFSPPDADEFEIAGLAEKPSKIVTSPGIAGCYAWMECELFTTYSEDAYTLIMGKVVRLEVADSVLTPDGSLDLEKARPLFMTGSKKGMHYCTATDIKQFDDFGAMFPDGHDPLAGKYK